MLGDKLPYDSLAALRAALFKERPQLARIGQIVASGPADIRQLSAMTGDVDKAPFRSVIDDYLPDQPDRARVRGDGRMLGPRRGPRRHDRGGVSAMVGILDRAISGR